MKFALRAQKMTGVTVELSAVDVEAATHIEDDAPLIDVGDGTYTCSECGRNGYPIPD